MIVTETTKSILRYRRQHRELTKLGYQTLDAHPEILRGSKTDHIIADVKISVNGKSLFIKYEVKQ